MMRHHAGMTDPQPEPRISVVTASFNAAPALARTLKSVADQTFAAIEHIVIDGGSEDGTRNMLQGEGARLRWVSEADRGIADALNKGVAMARGDYILVLQAGDTLADPDILAQVAARLGTVDIASFSVRITGEGEPPEGRIFPSTGLGPRLSRYMTVPHQGALVKASLFERIGGFDEQLKVAMDYDFMLRARAAGASCLIDPLVIAQMPADGISARRDRASLRARLAENRRVQARYLKTPRERLRHAAFWALYPIYKLRHSR
jgi:glycosyltransferase involved in cell wall biosynthesis